MQVLPRPCSWYVGVWFHSKKWVLSMVKNQYQIDHDDDEYYFFFVLHFRSIVTEQPT